MRGRTVAVALPPVSKGNKWHHVCSCLRNHMHAHVLGGLALAFSSILRDRGLFREIMIAR